VQPEPAAGALCPASDGNSLTATLQARHPGSVISVRDPRHATNWPLTAATFSLGQWRSMSSAFQVFLLLLRATVVLLQDTCKRSHDAMFM
jgi:hypothetical protein